MARYWHHRLNQRSIRRCGTFLEFSPHPLQSRPKTSRTPTRQRPPALVLDMLLPCRNSTPRAQCGAHRPVLHLKRAPAKYRPNSPGLAHPRHPRRKRPGSRRGAQALSPTLCSGVACLKAKLLVLFCCPNRLACLLHDTSNLWAKYLSRSWSPGDAQASMRFALSLSTTWGGGALKCS